MNTRPLDGTAFIAPFVPCPMDLIPHAFELASIGPEDVLVDLGCGDGRLLQQALTLDPPPAKVIGVELDPFLYEHASKALIKYSDKALVLQQDMFSVDLNSIGATVLVLYLLPAGLQKLDCNLQDFLSLDKNRRVVTIDYQIPGRHPARVVEVSVDSRLTPVKLSLYSR